LPCKDLKQKRRYDRKDKRRLRAQQGFNSRGQTPMSKQYIYLKVPHLRLGGMVSQDGWLISDNPEKQTIIDQHHPSYGREIFGWQLDP
jgi:hypothetical protein